MRTVSLSALPPALPTPTTSPRAENPTASLTAAPTRTAPKKVRRAKRANRTKRARAASLTAAPRAKAPTAAARARAASPTTAKRLPRKRTKKDDDGDDSNNLKLGGKSYEVGDVIVCTYSVNCPTKFINFQATLKYDGDKLKAINAETAGSASSGSVVNYDLDSKVKFNGIKLNGYNYTKGGSFLTVTYEVIGSGSTEPAISWEIITDTNNNPMVVNGEPVSDFKVESSYE